MEDILQTVYIWQLVSIFNIFQRVMDYLKPEVLITPATLRIQSREKQKTSTLNPLGILMLLWLDGGLGTATETHTQQHKGEPLAGREAIAPSVIIIKREVQRREETPPNGGVIAPEVSEAASVVGVKARGVVLAFDGGLTEQDKGPVHDEVLGSLPFLPHAPESGPGALSERAVQEAMLGGFSGPGVASVAGGGDSHHLQPCPGQEALVKG